MTIDGLYREEILDHYREPLNFGRLFPFDASSKQSNPFCGDEIEMFVRFNDGMIREIGFVGEGCAISIASASMLTDYAKEKKRRELTEFSENDMLNLLGIKVSETRKKCVLLALATLKDCLRI